MGELCCSCSQARFYGRHSGSISGWPLLSRNWWSYAGCHDIHIGFRTHFFHKTLKSRWLLNNASVHLWGCMECHRCFSVSLIWIWKQDYPLRTPVKGKLKSKHGTDYSHVIHVSSLLRRFKEMLQLLLFSVKKNKKKRRRWQHGVQLWSSCWLPVNSAAIPIETF